jgi:hypothetical protein
MMRDMNMGTPSLSEGLDGLLANYVSFKGYPLIYVEDSETVKPWIDSPSNMLDFLPPGENLPDRIFQGAVRPGHGIRRICSVVFTRLASKLSACYHGCHPYALVPHLNGLDKENTPDIDYLSETAPYLEVLFRAHPGLLLVTAFGMQGKTPEGEEDNE